MRSRPNTTQRGYGAAHQALRRRWTSQVERGEVTCWRCGRLIPPGAKWDLGHDDRDRSITRGPEHLRCNRSTASHRAGRRARRAVQRDYRSPLW